MEASARMSDVKEVRVGNVVSFTLNETCLVTVNNILYFKMSPSRLSGIAKMILSRCNADVKQQYRHNRRAFFLAPGAKGKSFLDMMREIIKTQRAKQFRVSKGRFFSRRKKERVEQQRTDEVIITLPAAGEYAPLRTTTIGKLGAILLPCTTEVIDHVTRLAKLHLEKEDEEVDIVEEDVDDMVGNNSEDREGGIETHEGECDDGHDNNANTHDANDERSTRMGTYPIFKAFHA